MKSTPVERWIAAWNAHDIDALCECAHERIVIVPTRHFAPPGTRYHGRDGVRTLMTHTFTHFPDATLEPVSSRRLLQHTLVTLRNSAAGDPEPTAAVLFDSDNRFVRRVQGFDTVDEAIAASRRVRDEFRMLFDEARDAIVLLNAAGGFIELNAAACDLLQRDRSDLLAMGIDEFVPREMHAEWRDCWEAVQTKGRAHGRMQVKTKRGTNRTIDFWASAEYGAGWSVGLFRVREDQERAGTADPILTAREREVLQFLADGLTAPQIADELFLSVLTVRTHVQNAMQRLGAKTRIQAITIALARGEIVLQAPA